MFELVVIWENGEKDIFTYQTREKAEKAGQGMQTALGKQIAFYCVRNAK